MTKISHRQQISKIVVAIPGELLVYGLGGISRDRAVALFGKKRKIPKIYKVKYVLDKDGEFRVLNRFESIESLNCPIITKTIRGREFSLPVCWLYKRWAGCRVRREVSIIAK